jgi:multiple sugar transport system permease protein
MSTQAPAREIATPAVRSWLSAGRRRPIDLLSLGAHAVLIVVFIASVAPFLWMLLGSFKNFQELTQYPPTVMPEQFTLQNYETVLFQINFLRSMFNSVFVAVLVTAATLTTSALAGYVFAKYHFWGKDALFVMLLSTMMVPFGVILIPLYITVSALGLHDNLWGLIVTGLCSTFGVFLMRQFIETIPNELLDAGRIDGASEWWIFARIVVPLSGAPLAALAVFTFHASWDNFLWPLVVLTSADLKTLPLALASLTSLYWTRYDLWVTGSCLTVLPTLVIYALAQKQFVRGIALSGLKA